MTETDAQFQSNWRGIRLELEGSLNEIVLQVALNRLSFSMTIKTKVNENRFESH